MTQLEDRLRQELRDMAQRVAPADLRPLRRPPDRAWSRRARWLAPAGAMVAVAAVIVGLVLAGQATGLSARGSSSAGRASGNVADPAALAVAIRAVTSSGRGLDVQVVLVSPLTGRILRRVTTTTMIAGEGNRFAFAPDGQSVYVQKPVADLRSALDQISIADGTERTVGYGTDPAVSPDSRQLAYATGGPGEGTLAITNLRTGSVRKIWLVKLLGPDETTVGGQITWLGDGTQLAVVPQGLPTSAGANAPVSAGGGGKQGQDGVCLIMIDASAPVLTARRICVPTAGLVQGQTPLNVVIGGADDGHRLLVAASSAQAGGYGGVEAVQLSNAGSVLTTRRQRSLPSDAAPVAFAPAGDRLVLRLSPLTFSVVKLTGSGPGYILPIPDPRRAVQIAW